MCQKKDLIVLGNKDFKSLALTVTPTEHRPNWVFVQVDEWLRKSSLILTKEMESRNIIFVGNIPQRECSQLLKGEPSKKQLLKDLIESGRGRYVLLTHSRQEFAESVRRHFSSVSTKKLAPCSST